MQSPQFHQLQMLTPQQQQQLLFQAQQNLTSTQGDVDSRRLKMFLNNRNMIPGKDSQSSSINDVIPNVGSPIQTMSPVLPRGETDMLIKVHNFSLL